MDESANHTSEILIGIFTLAGAVIALIGVAITAYLTNRNNKQILERQLEHEEKTKKQDMLRERLEEAHVLTNQYLRSIKLLTVQFHKVTANRQNMPPFNIVIDECNEILRKENTPETINRLSMIIHLYFTEIEPEFNAFLASGSVVTDQMVLFFKKANPSQPTDLLEEAKIFHNSLREVDEVATQLLKKLENIAKTL